MAIGFVAKNPALAPLFAAVGFAIAGSAWFGYNVLRHDPAVVLDKKGHPEQAPWNLVRQDQNIKLYSPNRSFWQDRIGIPDPRAAFLSKEDAASTRAKDMVKQIKERGTASRE